MIKNMTATEHLTTATELVSRADDVSRWGTSKRLLGGVLTSVYIRDLMGEAAEHLIAAHKVRLNS